MIKIILLSVLVIIIIVAGGVFWYMQQPIWGAEPKGERLARIQASPNYKNGEFQNLNPVEVMVNNDPDSQSSTSMVSALYKFFFEKDPNSVPDYVPAAEHKVDLKHLDPNENIIVWMGHSSLFMQLEGKKILVDPVFSGYGAPVSFANRAFNNTDQYTVDDIPELDILLISHDHYDHLDYETVKALIPKSKQIVTALGVGAHLELWGAKLEQIWEGDWNDVYTVNDSMKIHVLPTQHFSGRTLKRNQTLWASFAFITPNHRIFMGADGGYSPTYQLIGQEFGPFDLAILENGQYDEQWHAIHAMPEETATIAEELRAKRVMPIHNSKFKLAHHEWTDPMDRLLAASEGKFYDVLTPMIGEELNIDSPNVTTHTWWK